MKNYLFLLPALLIFSCTPDSPSADLVFLHGVASGDPLPDGVIIWTRISPSSSVSGEVSVRWELATDENFNEVISTGTFTTDPGKDYTVKEDVRQLKPGSTYYYRFMALGDTSATGKTKTASMASDSLQFAVVSCSNYEWGYFNAYGRIAEKANLEAVIHLGDYLYEYAPGGYGDTTTGRKHLPENELITLEDYRIRYAQYHSDPDLQAVHAFHPFIAIWDDHEIANDSYKEGAQNHQKNEGDYQARRAAAIKAYYEWMPIRPGEKLYRRFAFGSLVDLYMLDERMEGRSKQVDSLSDPTYASTDRTMLGKAQLEWIKQGLRQSESTWKIIGNQVIFSDLNQEAVFPDWPRNLDSWDGYPAEKREIAKTIVEDSIKNIIWITGDTHSSWALETVINGYQYSPIAVEFGTPSISSANYDEYTSVDTALLSEKLYLETNPQLKYVNLLDHGYYLLTVTPRAATATYYYVPTVTSRSNEEKPGAIARVSVNTTRLIIDEDRGNRRPRN